MNMNVLTALLKTEFAFDSESYIKLRDTCREMVQRTTPDLLSLTETEIINYMFGAGDTIERLYEEGVRFDKEDYNREIESQAYCNDETRARIFFDHSMETVDEQLIVSFVIAMAMYAGQCDEDNDFWEIYGLSGINLDLTKGVGPLFVQYCIKPLLDKGMRYFDRKMAVMLHGLYSLAVSIMGEEDFKWHLQNFFYYAEKAAEDEGNEMYSDISIFQHPGGDC